MRTSSTLAAAVAVSLLLLCGGEAEAQRSRSRQGPGGGTSSTSRQVQNTGNGAYQKSGSRTWMGPRGTTGSVTSEGGGQITGGKGQGVQNVYQGQVTTGKGNTYDVDHSADYHYDPTTGLTRDGSTTVTNSAGQGVTSSSSSSAKQGEGYQRGTTITGPANADDNRDL